MSGPTSTLSPIDDLPPKPSGASKLIWACTALGIAALLLYFGHDLVRPHRPMGPRHPGAGTPLPRLELTPCVGADDELTSKELAGKVALINFWGTWCPPCREEFPHLMKLRESRVSRGDFQFVSVTSSSTGHDDAQELAREVTEFLRMSGVDLAVYCDPNGRTRIPLAQRLKFDGFSYPTTVVVDRKGVIRGIWVGYLAGEERDIERLVDKLLDEKST